VPHSFDDNLKLIVSKRGNLVKKGSADRKEAECLEKVSISTLPGKNH